MSEEKDIDTMSVGELKEYIAILLDRIIDMEKSIDYYERIAKALSK
jgi:uncharacterized small protein (DUF1192 family)